MTFGDVELSKKRHSRTSSELRPLLLLVRNRRCRSVVAEGPLLDRVTARDKFPGFSLSSHL